MLLSGQPPFDGPSEQAIKRSIVTDEVDTISGCWATRSTLAKELIRSMLVGAAGLVHDLACVGCVCGDGVRSLCIVMCCCCWAR